MRRSCGLLTLLIDSGETERTRKFLLFVSSYLFHPFPVVRRVTAEAFYLIVMDVDGENKSVLEDLLLNTLWNESLETGLKARVNTLIGQVFSI